MHRLACEVAGKMQGYYFGDIGYTGDATLDIEQLNYLLEIVAVDVELQKLTASSKKSSNTSAKSSQYSMQHRNIRSRRKNDRRSHDAPTIQQPIWEPLSKRHRRHLELCAKLIRHAQRFYISNQELKNKDEIVQMLVSSSQSKDKKSKKKKSQIKPI